MRSSQFIFVALQFLFIYVCIHEGKRRNSKARKIQDTLSSQLDWNAIFDDSIEVHSYLFNNSSTSNQNRGIPFIQDLMKVIYKTQHPTKEECKTRRLSVIQMSSNSFEGTGSIIKQIMIGIAIALHSQRTIVWGLGLPFLFEHSKELWAGEESENLRINNDFFDCKTGNDRAGGPFGCFFERLSTCSLADATPSEILEFSHNPYNETARLMLAEIRRGPALYVPPLGLFEHIWTKKSSTYTSKLDLFDYRGKEGHLWSAAVAAYVFRLKPEIANNLNIRYSDKIFAGKENVWGLHVRHGDLKALKNVYSYKEIFEFDDYFAAARDLSLIQKKSPNALFVSTDSIEADSIQKLFDEFMTKKNKKSSAVGKIFASKVEQLKMQELIEDNEEEEEEDYEEDNDDEEDEEYDEEEDDEDDDEDDYHTSSKKSSNKVGKIETSQDAVSSLKSTQWYNKQTPSIISINNTDRYRTAHGSHTVAANGGCLRDPKYSEKGMRCALNYEDIILYQGIEEHRAVPRSFRLMRVLLESIEDIYLLSRCGVIIAQGSSHFSTLSALLIWARTGALDPMQTAVFLDYETVASGITPTAFLHGMNLLNGTNGLDPRVPNAGMARWKMHSVSFISGMETAKEGGFKARHILTDSTLNPWNKDNMLRIVNGIPSLPEKVFYKEAESWIQKIYQPVWPGMCPGPIKKFEDPTTYAVNVINLGVEHLDVSHTGQALQCWADSLNVLNANPQLQSEAMVQARDVVTGNMKAMRVMRYAEMVINENNDPDSFYDYNQKYMTEEATLDGKDAGAGTRTLDEIIDEIAKLEIKLNKLKATRDKMYELAKRIKNDGTIV